MGGGAAAKGTHTYRRTSSCVKHLPHSYTEGGWVEGEGGATCASNAERDCSNGKRGRSEHHRCKKWTAVMRVAKGKEGKKRKQTFFFMGCEEEEEDPA